MSPERVGEAVQRPADADRVARLTGALSKCLHHFEMNPRLYRVSGPEANEWMPIVDECRQALWPIAGRAIGAVAASAALKATEAQRSSSGEQTK